MTLSHTLSTLAESVAGQQYPPATLYVVATPIGNVADLGMRALQVLALVDAVACEDTRVSGQLLHRLGLQRPLITLHRHNEEAAAAQVIERLAAGARIACVSDAGTPAVSDPGARLVAAVSAAGYRVVPIPGASSVAAALSAAGDAVAQGHLFVGFLPTKAAERSRVLQDALRRADGDGQGPPLALLLFEAPHRIEELAAQLAEHRPERRVTVCRELSKQFEQITTRPGTELPAWFAAQADHRRGEFVVVVHAQAPSAASQDEALPAQAERLLQVLLAELPLKQAASLAAQATGLPRKALYQRALTLRAVDDTEDTADTPHSRA